jgi:hypothetical protein
MEVEVLQQLEGPAEAILVGLPHNVTAEPLKITNETKQLVFNITTKEDSPAGNHKNIFCRVTASTNNEPVMHNQLGVTELRIDKPLPKPVEKPAEVAKKEEPKPAAPAPPAEKRLTRLEKLRLEAKKAAQGGGDE